MSAHPLGPRRPATQQSERSSGVPPSPRRGRVPPPSSLESPASHEEGSVIRRSASLKTPGGHPNTTTINLQTPAGVQRLRYQLSVLAATEHHPVAIQPTPGNTSRGTFQPSSSRPQQTSDALLEELFMKPHAGGPQLQRKKNVSIFTDALRHQQQAAVAARNKGPVTAGESSSSSESKHNDVDEHQHRMRQEQQSIRDQALLQSNQQTLTVQVLLRENMRATTTARSETEIVAQALDKLVGDVVAKHTSVLPPLPCLDSTTSSSGKMQNAAVPFLLNKRPALAHSQPPWMDDVVCFSDGQDATSVVQNHALGHPRKIDDVEFLSSQRSLARVFFAGMHEVAQLVRSQCARRATLLQVLTNALEALMDNAHDATAYYASMVHDVASLKLAETVKELSRKLRDAGEEKSRLEERLMRLQHENESLEGLRLDHHRLQERQITLDQFLKDQLGRNAAIMKMASQATGGVIPAHVVAAMTGANGGAVTGGPGLGAARRRSTRSRSFVRLSQQASHVDGGNADDLDFNEGSSSGMPTPNRGPLIAANASGAFEAPPFFLQGAQDGEDTGGPTNPLVDGQEGDGADGSPFDDYELVDAGVQTGIEDAVNCQLVGEMNAYFNEMDKAANFSQALCRVVYGTTDFYNPGECCDNARRLLEEITQRGQDLKEAAAVADGMSAGSPSTQRSLLNGSSAAGGGGGGGGNRVNFATLIGFIDLPKERVVKLIQYGSNAAREMRLRFASMAENESFRRAVEWRPPRAPRDPCRLCARLGPLPEEQAALAEVDDLRARVTTLEAELGESKSDLEKMHKRVEHERQVAQSHYDDIQAIYKVKFAMQGKNTQTDVVVTYSSGAQTESPAYGGVSDWIVPDGAVFATSAQDPTYHRLAQHAAIPTASSVDGPGWGTTPRRSPFAADGSVTEASSLSETPTAPQPPGLHGWNNTSSTGPPGGENKSPFPSTDAEWSQFRNSNAAGGGSARLGSGGVDSTFVTRSANVSARRRSSIEVTFDREALINDSQLGSGGGGGGGPTDSPGGYPVLQQLGRTNERRLSSNRPTSGTSPYSEASRISPPTSASGSTRRGSEFSMAALKFRDAFLSLTRTGGTGGGGGVSLPSIYRDRVSPIDVDALTLSSGPVKSHGWAIKLLSALYRTRYSGGSSSAAASQLTAGSDARTTTPDNAATCSRHFTDFLRQNFGTRQLIDDNAANFLRCVHQYAPTDPRFSLFAKLFSDEYHREVYRQFLKFSLFLDQTQSVLESSGGNAGASKRLGGGDDHAEPCLVQLESVLHSIYSLYWNNERIQNREEFCNLLASKAVELSRAQRNGANGPPSAGGVGARKDNNMKIRRASLAIKAFDSTPPSGALTRSPSAGNFKTPTPPPQSASATPPSGGGGGPSSALGTPIESSDSFSKYRGCFSVTIPPDSMHRVLLRVAFMSYLCDIARPYVMHSVSEPSLSPASSRPTSAPQMHQQ